jgi:hypothetical protein
MCVTVMYVTVMHVTVMYVTVMYVNVMYAAVMLCNQHITHLKRFSLVTFSSNLFRWLQNVSI